jgi:excisionase family DNA binding protein
LSLLRLYVSKKDGIRVMEKAYLTINDVSQYLNVKVSTLYTKVSEIPHYRVGNLIRFKKEDIDAWMESQKSPGRGMAVVQQQTKRTGKRVARSGNKAASIVWAAIDEIAGRRYNSTGKSDPVKGLEKEANNGIV